MTITTQDRILTNEGRLDRFESIMRDRVMHEPDCPVRAAEKNQGKAPPKKVPVCDCWLSGPAL